MGNIIADSNFYIPYNQRLRPTYERMDGGIEIQADSRTNGCFKQNLGEKIGKEKKIKFINRNTSKVIIFQNTDSSRHAFYVYTLHKQLVFHRSVYASPISGQSSCLCFIKRTNFWQPRFPFDNDLDSGKSSHFKIRDRFKDYLDASGLTKEKLGIFLAIRTYPRFDEYFHLYWTVDQSADQIKPCQLACT